MKQNFSNIVKSAACLLYGLMLALAVAGQSTDQNYPSPVTSTETNGRIKVRDVGDSRLTSHYYAFDGGQGDIFINVVTKNFNGNIDVFAVDGLRSLTKMVIYADSGSSETGRLVYLRKPERLLLRVEGRSPNDDPATYTIKFGGSFIALKAEKPEEAPTIVSDIKPDDPGVRVNSVGTIIKVVPKAQPIKIVPEKKTEIAKVKKPEAKPAKIDTPKAEAKPVPNSEVYNKIEEPKPIEATTVAKIEPPVESKPEIPTKAPVKKSVTKKPVAKVTKPVAKTAKETTTANVRVEKPIDPLASIRLLIELKDGTSFWRPMNEVLKFSIDKGVYVVVAKDGTISRYAILDVAKVTIQ